MKYKHIASILCLATERILWAKTQSWCLDKNPALRFSSRVGAGKKTYHLLTGNISSITYGEKMVASKFSKKEALNWLSSKEVVDRRYFDGVIDIPNLLAHICAHEFAHLVQRLRGERTKGSVHNPAFYRILDRMHGSGIVHEIRDFIFSECHKKGISLDFVGDSDAAIPPQKATDFCVGQQVVFVFNGQEKIGIVVKKMRKNLVIKDAHSAARYRCPAAGLRKAG